MKYYIPVVEVINKSFLKTWKIKEQALKNFTWKTLAERLGQ